MGKDIDEINKFLDEHEKKKEIKSFGPKLHEKTFPGVNNPPIIEQEPKPDYTQPMLHRKELRKFALTDEELKELEDASK